MQFTNWSDFLAINSWRDFRREWNLLRYLTLPPNAQLNYFDNPTNSPDCKLTTHSKITLRCNKRRSKRKIQEPYFRSGNILHSLASAAEASFFVPRALNALLGSFSNDDGDGNENGKKSYGFVSKTTSLHVLLVCIFLQVCTFLCRYCTTTIWECQISRFMGDVKKPRRNLLYLFKPLSAVPKKSTPAKLTCIRHFQRIGINATKFEKR